MGIAANRSGTLLFVYLKLCFTAFFWGGTFISGRIIAENIEPFSAAFLRFAIASLVLPIIVWKKEGAFPKPDRSQFIILTFLGITGVVTYNVFFFKGLEVINAGRASVIIAMNPIFISAASAWIFKEKLTKLKILGIILSISGSIIVISKGSLADITRGVLGWGEIFIFCCVVSWVCYTIIGKSVMMTLSPIVAVTYSAIIGAIGLFFPACFEGLLIQFLHYSALEWFNLFYLGYFGTVLGFSWYFQGIASVGAIRAGQFINIVPISAIILAFIILKEPITPSLFIGALFVITGVYITNINVNLKSG